LKSGKSNFSKHHEPVRSIYKRERCISEKFKKIFWNDLWFIGPVYERVNQVSMPEA
jgi:hypothetical protein